MNPINTFNVLWGWISNPIRIFKFILGASLIFLALVLLFREQTQEAVKEVAPQAAKVAEGAAAE